VDLGRTTDAPKQRVLILSMSTAILDRGGERGNL